MRAAWVLCGAAALIGAWGCRGDTCLRNSDCNAQELCLRGDCLRQCDDDFDCPLGKACAGGACQPESDSARPRPCAFEAGCEDAGTDGGDVSLADARPVDAGPGDGTPGDVGPAADATESDAADGGRDGGPDGGQDGGQDGAATDMGPPPRDAAGDGGSPPSDAELDAAPDARPDTGADAGPPLRDAALDVGPDAALDADLDIGQPDAELDIGQPDAELDIGQPDAELDIGQPDAELDLGPDDRLDAGAPLDAGGELDAAPPPDSDLTPSDVDLTGIYAVTRVVRLSDSRDYPEDQVDHFVSRLTRVHPAFYRLEIFDQEGELVLLREDVDFRSPEGRRAYQFVYSEEIADAPEGCERFDERFDRGVVLGEMPPYTLRGVEDLDVELDGEACREDDALVRFEMDWVPIPPVP